MKTTLFSLKFYQKRICQCCSKEYLGTANTRYCSVDCAGFAKSARQKAKYQWQRTQRTLTLEERRKELDDILGTDE